MSRQKELRNPRGRSKSPMLWLVCICLPRVLKDTCTVWVINASAQTYSAPRGSDPTGWAVKNVGSANEVRPVLTYKDKLLLFEEFKAIRTQSQHS